MSEKLPKGIFRHNLNNYFMLDPIGLIISFIFKDTMISE